ncbi:site-specific integrase [Taibaiella sp. KBW10]|uniref:site-specific integrase n=1 Tax=Taibaiella sp. KBW10 TaxID=2153357 RepID=UPI0018F74A11|nr:site-specific integrase [Taibaiella sp. KBW10]
MNIKQEKPDLLFWLQRSKKRKDGKVPISVRITIDCASRELSLGASVLPEHWDVERKMVLRQDADHRSINTKIRKVSVDMERIYDTLCLQYAVVTPEMVKNVYNGKSAVVVSADMADAENFTLMVAFSEFIERFAKMVGQDNRSDGTLRHWRSTKTKVLAFLESQYRVTDIAFGEIRPAFADEFYDYLTIYVDYPLADPTAKKHIKKLKQIIKAGVKKQIISANPIADFVCGGDLVDIPPLELQQVFTIQQKDFGVDRLNEVRDAFIFQCFTGFAYQDIYALSPENIVLVDKERWLIKDRGKTGVSEIVPILPNVEELITKYKDHPKCKVRNALMPVSSNTRYNGYLKEIALICGLDRELNTHLARHTFADMMLNLGVPLEDVSKMLGHRSIRTTQRYCRVRKERISRNINLFVRSKLFDEKGKLMLVG